MLTDYEIAQAMNSRSLLDANDDSPWWLLFARDIERLTRQHCALERMTDDAQRLGLYDESPKAAGWAEGFTAGDAWRERTTEFWRTHDEGAAPEAPANPYKP